MSIYSNLLSLVYDIKHKITDQEYINIVTEITNLNNIENNNIFYDVKYIYIITFSYIDINNNIEIKTHTSFENKICKYSFKSPDDNTETFKNLFEKNIICDDILQDQNLINNYTKCENYDSMKIIKQIIDITKIEN